MESDSELLRQYLECQSNEAFAALVARHVDLVYSVAMRQTSNPHHAEEITQAVFIILARKAGQLRHDKALGSWLFQTTRLTANNFIRGEMRRHYREQEAYMQSAHTELGHDELWQRIGPVLDNAVGALNEKDRRAIVLRFYEGRSFSEVGAALNGNEESGRKRVVRALEKLQRFFSKRGVHSSSSVFGEAISMNSVQAAPATLAKSVTSVAIAKGAAATASMATLVKGTMNTMKWLKMKFAVGMGAAVLIAGGIVTVAVSETTRTDAQAAKAIIQKSQDAYAALSSYSDSGEITQEIGNQTLQTTFNIRMQRPNLYRIDWTQATDYFTNGGVAWSADGNNNYLQIRPWRKPETYGNLKPVLATAAGVSGGTSSTIPAIFFNKDFKDLLRGGNATSQPDDTVEGVDCYVVSSTAGKASTARKTKTTVWIGKQDYLIRQTQTVMEGISVKIPVMNDTQIARMLQQGGKPATPEAIAAEKTRLQEANKQAEKTMESKKFVSTQVHRDIVVNQKFSTVDFDRGQ